MEQITLYYRQGSSDKIYQASIEPKGDGYVVHFAFGRRGTTLQTGTKTTSPVDYAQAKGFYDRLVREKTTKGYTPGVDGTPYLQTAKAQHVSGLLPQLLNPVEESDIERLIADPAFALQEKLDGRHLLLRKDRDSVSGINRLSLEVD